MKKYYDNVMQKEPHHRRQHAMQIAGVVTAAVFAVWITTLGLRLGGGQTQVAQDAAGQTSLSASAAQATYNGQNQLMVAPTNF